MFKTVGMRNERMSRERVTTTLIQGGRREIENEFAKKTGHQSATLVSNENVWRYLKSTTNRIQYAYVYSKTTISYLHQSPEESQKKASRFGRDCHLHRGAISWLVPSDDNWNNSLPRVFETTLGQQLRRQGRGWVETLKGEIRWHNSPAAATIVIFLQAIRQSPDFDLGLSNKKKLSAKKTLKRTAWNCFLPKWERWTVFFEIRSRGECSVSYFDPFTSRVLLASVAHFTFNVVSFSTQNSVRVLALRCFTLPRYLKKTKFFETEQEEEMNKRPFSHKMDRSSFLSIACDRTIPILSLVFLCLLSGQVERVFSLSPLSVVLQS